MRIRREPLWVWMRALALIALASGCSTSEETTQVVVEIDADPALRDKLTRVDVESYDPATTDAAGKPLLVGKLPFEISAQDGAAGVTFRFSFGVIKNKADQFLLVVTGFEGAKAVVEQKARIGFVNGESRKVEIKLAQACYGLLCAEPGTSAWFQSTCDADQGSCSSVTTRDRVASTDAGGDDADAAAPDSVDEGSVAKDAGAFDAQGGQLDGGSMDGGPNVGTDVRNMDASNGASDATQPRDAASVTPDSGTRDTGMMSDAQGFVGIVAGGNACYAQRADGTVAAWGRNPYGQFANGTTMDSNLPLTITSLGKMAEIATTEYFTCARRSNGTVACAGYNSQGELGNGGTALSPSLVEVTGLSNVAEIAVGYTHACARRMNGTVACWGENARGQLGNTTVTAAFSASPVEVLNLTNAVEIAAGGYHSCARRADSSVVCWGLNLSRQLGNPANASDSSAGLVQVVAGGDPSNPVLVSPVELSLGEWHSCARLLSGAVACWGNGSNGELGNALDMDSAIPVRVTNLSGVAEISLNRFYSCARKQDGTVSCWGAWPGVDVSTPVPIAGVSSATQLATGQFHACARTADGNVVCWGQNDYGQLGRGTTAVDLTPVTTAAPVKAH